MSCGDWQDRDRPSENPLKRGSLISGERRLEREELQQRVARATSTLAGLGVGAGDTVALLLRNDFPFFEASLAAGALGAFAVPVNWHFSGEEAGYVLRDCGARLLVAHADLIGGVSDHVPDETLVLIVETPPEIATAYGIPADACRRDADAPAWNEAVAAHEPWTGARHPAPASMIYTSGTTGRPKGVRREASKPEHRGLLARLNAAVLDLGPEMRTVLTGPLYHTAPNVYGLGVVRAGGSMVLQPRFDAEELLALVERYRITHLNMVPTMFVRLLRLPEAVRSRYDLSSLVRVTHAAAPCPPEVKRAMIDWWGPILVEYYGGTESGVITACSSSEWLRHPGTVGRPVEGAVLRILDDERRELPAGEVGEVFMRFEGIGDFTYHGREEERRAVERQGLITCGDMGFVDEDGYLYLRDRKRDMVISGGVNVYPAEIEAVLLGHGAVRDCAVFGIPDPEFGEALVAVVQTEPGRDLAADDVQRYLRERLAGFKVPRRIEFRTDLPREDSGKIFKRKLREPYWEGTGRRI